jgi:hypothetical protein
VSTFEQCSEFSELIELARPNYSSITAPPPANVTSKTFENVYVYAAWRLWLPYGIAILMTTVTALVGLATMFVNDASYSSNFSTVFRTAQVATMSAPIEKEEDLDGKDPLPKYLAQATIYLGRKEATRDRLLDRAVLLDAPADPPLEQQPVRIREWRHTR